MRPPFQILPRASKEVRNGPAPTVEPPPPTAIQGSFSPPRIVDFQQCSMQINAP